MPECECQVIEWSSGEYTCSGSPTCHHTPEDARRAACEGKRMAMSRKPVGILSNKANDAYAEALNAVSPTVGAANVSPTVGDGMDALEQQIVNICESGNFSQAEIGELLELLQRDQKAAGKRAAEMTKQGAAGSSREDRMDGANMQMSLTTGATDPDPYMVAAHFREKELGRPLTTAESFALSDEIVQAARPPENITAQRMSIAGWVDRTVYSKPTRAAAKQHFRDQGMSDAEAEKLIGDLLSRGI